MYAQRIRAVVLFSAASFTFGHCIAAAEKPSAAPGENSPPRYRMQVGQELNYEGSSDFKHEHGSHGTKSTFKVTVVRQNPDGGWRLLVRTSSAFGQSLKEGEPIHYSNPRVTTVYCDLTSDGQIPENPTLGFHASVRSVLPQLPATAEETEWKSENALTGTTYLYSLVPATESPAGHLTIDCKNQSAMDEIYLASSSSRFQFDLAQGVIDEITTESAQGYGFVGKGTGKISLVAINEVDTAQCAQIAADLDRYFGAKQAYDELIERAGKEPADSKELLAQAKSLLEEMRKEVKSPTIVEEANGLLEKHSMMANYVADDAARFAKVLGQPSPGWETTDFQGSTRSIEGCKGKVVVLDFWYRGCGWCIRAMPQMKQIAAHFKGQPVEIFGMNTDRNEDDAKLVIEKMQLDYPNLKAEGVPEKYGVQGFPTLVIIDQAGVVRDVHVGYSPHLATSVVASIDKLLANPPADK